MTKRRSNGEGNIRKRKDGRWEGRYTAGIHPETGKQIFKNVLGKTQAEVKEKLKKALEQNQKIDFTRTGKYTVEQWMDEWFENVCKIKVRPSSHTAGCQSAVPVSPAACRLCLNCPSGRLVSSQGL